EQDNAIASAWLILGQSLELQGRNLAAIEAYQIASEIAFENGESEIVVLARVALGQLGVSTPQ
ncbi:MAG: hypothetical protein R3264_06805, partial [Anaerolineae bacterium]|nr:hypothetical protein [Anaerolineae bacterium]